MVRYFISHITESQNVPKWADLVVATATTSDIFMQLPKINKKLHGKLISFRRTDIQQVDVQALAATGDTIDGVGQIRSLFGGQLESCQLLADNNLKSWITLK